MELGFHVPIFDIDGGATAIAGELARVGAAAEESGATGDSGTPAIRASDDEREAIVDRLRTAAGAAPPPRPVPARADTSLPRPGVMPPPAPIALLRHNLRRLRHGRVLPPSGNPRRCPGG